jgi:two-component system sensor histidine kinase TctE
LPISAIALQTGGAVKIFQREQRSLFGEILDWMLTPLLLLWP